MDKARQRSRGALKEAKEAKNKKAKANQHEPPGKGGLMKGKDPRLGVSQGPPSLTVMPKPKKEFKMETPQDGVEASLGTQLLTKPVSQGETGKSSVLRPGGTQREHKELLGQISVQQEGRGPVKPI